MERPACPGKMLAGWLLRILQSNVKRRGPMAKHRLGRGWVMAVAGVWPGSEPSSPDAIPARALGRLLAQRDSRQEDRGQGDGVARDRCNSDLDQSLRQRIRQLEALYDRVSSIWCRRAALRVATSKIKVERI